MQYKQANERATMIPIGGTYVPTASLPDDNSQARRTRRYLIIILSIVIVLNGIHVCWTFFGGAISNEKVRRPSGYDIALPIVEICLCVFGIVVAYRYFATGLRVYAGLNIVFLILYGLLVVTVIIILIISETNSFQRIANGEKSNADMFTRFSQDILKTIIVVFVIFIITAIVSIIVIVLSLRLARLIDVAKHSAISQI